MWNVLASHGCMHGLYGFDRDIAAQVNIVNPTEIER